MKTPRLPPVRRPGARCGPAESHEMPDRLGKVSFPTSCDPKVQPLFDAAVAMQHSYWFPEAHKTFNTVLERDPACAIAYWGLAVNYVGNSLVAPPPPKDVEAGWNALEKARAAGAKTQRERDWIEAISAYYRDHDKIALSQRLAAYSKAMERMTERYPGDFEAWVYYALTLQATAPTDDKTTRTSAEPRKFSSDWWRRIRSTPERRTISCMRMTTRLSPPRASRSRAPMESSRRPRRMRATCRLTSTPWSACGRTRSSRTSRPWRFSPTTTMRTTSRSMLRCSWRRTLAPSHSSTRRWKHTARAATNPD